MIAACPTLKDKISGAKGRDSNNTITMKSFPGGSLAIIGANSPSDLASKPVRYVFFDEIDRFPPSAGTEGDPIGLAERRTETFVHNRKIVKTSTPTIKGRSPIERAYMKGTQEEWHTECPACKAYQFIRFDDIRFDKSSYTDEDGKEHFSVSNPRWRCPNCGQETDEHAVKRLPAKWVKRNERALQNGVRSFRLNAFMSPWSDWRKICLAFLQAKNDPELLKVWHNTMLGESWEIRNDNEEPEQLMNRREHYNAEVPSGVLVMTMGIDTQDNRLEYEVVGWDEAEESWGIEKGIIPGRPDSPGVWQEVDNLLEREWSLPNGNAMRVMATFIDSGGHFTQDIYRECARRASRKIWPIKGEGGESHVYVKPMSRGTGYKGATGFVIGVDSGKEAILSATKAERGEPRYMHFSADERRGYDMTYFKGLCSERQVIHRRNGQSVIAWEKVEERNEPLDCRNYARAAYRYFNWNFRKIRIALESTPDEEERTAQELPPQKRKGDRRIVSRGIQI